MRGTLRVTLLAGGLIAALTGVIWIGQGTGYFPYPAWSFMINEISWVYRGAVLAVAGLIAAALSRAM